MDACNTGTFIMENFEMLKALYDFQAVYPKTISFDEGEHFVLYQTSAKQRNWWQVVSMKGAIGFVPSNYVMKIKVEPGFLLGFLESSIASLERSTDEDCNGIISRVELIERLRVKRTQASVSASILESDSDNNGAYDNEKHYTAAASAAASAAAASSSPAPLVDTAKATHKTRGQAEGGPAAAGATERRESRDKTSATAANATAAPPAAVRSSSVAAAPPPTKQFIPESPSMPRLDDPDSAMTSPTTTPTAQQQSFAASLADSAVPHSAASVATTTSNSTASAAAYTDNSIASEPSEATTTCSDDCTVISQAIETQAVQPTVAALEADIEEEAAADAVATGSPPASPVKAVTAAAEPSKPVTTSATAKQPASAVAAAPANQAAPATNGTAPRTTSSAATTPTPTVARPIPEIIEPQAPPQPPATILRGSSRTPSAASTPPNDGSGGGNGYGANGQLPAAVVAGPPIGEQTLRVDAAEVYQIIDTIRQTTNLSHRLSCVALQVVLSELETIYSTRILHLLEPIAIHLTGAQPLEAPADCREHTHDAQRLKCIFAKLQACTADSEQRTWVLHEDEAYIVRLLSELGEIVRNADRTVCRAALAADRYDGVHGLVQYYQMETRWSIRALLLDALRGLARVDAAAVVDGVLLVSVLPLELVQDMRGLRGARQSARLREVAQMATMVFALGGRMPVQHRDHIGPDFIHFIVELIERPPAADDDQDEQDQLSDVLINLLIAFNQQFDAEPSENIVVQAMRDVPLAKTFTEKILVLLNRDEDPIRFFDDVPRTVPNAVLKLFVDLFATAETAALFYSNDNKVLIDILVRQLSDLSAGDSLRRTYLELCRRIVRNTDYPEHQHRKSDLMKIFTRIFCEEGECSRADQQLVREIANEFAFIFKA